MGATLNKIYKIVTQKAGFKGRMRLAVKTGISRTKALRIEDTKEAIAKFRSAANEIIGRDISEFF